MADFVSSLNGVQMDAALIDMAEHNSEAWAVGERNGIPVGSDDVTYQNNAQYYAQQAQSIAPASVTEAVRWDIAQTALTDANKAQARSNIDAGKNGAWSNRNLLDNAYFVGGGSQLGDGVFPINQRGQSSYSGAVYGIDRWTENGNGTVTLNADSITFTNTRTWWDGICQKFSGEPFLRGEAVTASVMLNDGSIAYGTATVPTTDDTQCENTSLGNSGVQFSVRTKNSYGYSQFFLIIAPNASATVKAAKLELGTVSTLANDPPPDFGEELRKCLRYLWVVKFPANTVIGAGLTFNTATIYDIVTPVAMRTGGTLTMTTSTSLYVVYNATYALAGVVNGITSLGNHLRVSMDNNSGSDYGTLNHADLLVSYETVVTVANEP